MIGSVLGAISDTSLKSICAPDADLPLGVSHQHKMIGQPEKVLRVTLTVFGLVWAAQFLVFHAWWTRFVTARGWRTGFTPANARYVPYAFAFMSFVWALLVATTGLRG